MRCQLDEDVEAAELFLPSGHDLAGACGRGRPREKRGVLLLARGGVAQAAGELLYCAMRWKKRAGEVLVNMTPMMGVPLVTATQLGPDRLVLDCKK